MSLSDRIYRETGWKALDEESVEDLVVAKLQPPDAVPTGFPSWNRVCRDEGGGVGLARGWHVTVAAKTGHGKSIIAANIARGAMQAGEKVGFISLEMSTQQLDTRQLAILSGEPVKSLEMGSAFDEASYRRALARVAEIRQTTGGRIYRSEELMKDIRDIEGAVEYMRNGAPGCRFFIVDYIQLAGNPNDPESITQVSHRIRQLARDLDVVTVGLSQFNRDTFKRGGRPDIHDLTGGSALENDSDQVVILDHTGIEREQNGWTAPLWIAKNRHGPGIDFRVRFDSRTLRFEELQPDEESSYTIGG